MPYNTLWQTGSGVIAMDDVSCTGNEADLTQCSYTASHNCGHTEDVGVVCEGAPLLAPTNITNGSFSLIIDPNHPIQYAPDNSIASVQGRVEVCNGNGCGTICDDYFDSNNNGAIVVCRSLGLPVTNAAVLPYGSLWETASGPIVMDDISCTGNEADLTECSYITTNNCSHSEDVGVVCAM